MKIIGLEKLKTFNTDNITKENIINKTIELEELIKGIKIKDFSITKLKKAFKKKGFIDDGGTTSDTFYMWKDIQIIEELPENTGYSDSVSIKIEIFIPNDSNNKVVVDIIYFLDEIGDSIESLYSLFEYELKDYKQDKEIFEKGKIAIQNIKKGILDSFNNIDIN